MFLQSDTSPECYVTPLHSQSLKSINKGNHNFTRVLLLDSFTLEIPTVEDNRKDRTEPQRNKKPQSHYMRFFTQPVSGIASNLLSYWSVILMKWWDNPTDLKQFLHFIGCLNSRYLYPQWLSHSLWMIHLCFSIFRGVKH